MKDNEMRLAAKEFAAYWKDKGYEKGESQPFWLELLGNVFGVENPAHYIKFEEQVHLDHTSFIDGFIPATHVLIEQKGTGKDLQGRGRAYFQHGKGGLFRLPLCHLFGRRCQLRRSDL